MIDDRPANPRIRTKINRWTSPLSDPLFLILEDLRTHRTTTETFQKQLHDLLFSVDLSQHFEKEMTEARHADDQVWLLRRHVDGCRYTVIVYRVDDGEVHPPHHHHNLISTQIVLDGAIHLREYDRISREKDGIKLKLVNDAVLQPGMSFQVSEWSRNAHWFCGHGGPALLFNINARGYEEQTFDPSDDGPFGRRYLDPTIINDAGEIVAEQLDKEEAERRFQGKTLSEFPVPEVHQA